MGVLVISTFIRYHPYLDKETFDSFLDYESPRGRWYSSYTYYDYIVKITDIEEYTKQKFKES